MELAKMRSEKYFWVGSDTIRSSVKKHQKRAQFSVVQNLISHLFREV